MLQPGRHGLAYLTCSLVAICAAVLAAGCGSSSSHPEVTPVGRTASGDIPDTAFVL